jgi:hypothetical protein
LRARVESRDDGMDRWTSRGGGARATSRVRRFEDARARVSRDAMRGGDDGDDDARDGNRASIFPASVAFAREMEATRESRD